MGVRIHNNFELDGNVFNFERDSVNSKADLVSVSSSIFAPPVGFICFCKEDNSYYQMWNEENPAGDVGKWRKLFVYEDDIKTASRGIANELLGGYVKKEAFEALKSELNAEKSKVLALQGELSTIKDKISFIEENYLKK